MFSFLFNQEQSISNLSVSQITDGSGIINISYDLAHYDSDKSYSGRSFAISQIENSLDESSLIIMDDIQTNSHFYDLIEEKRPDSWYIFEFLGKHIGMIGTLRKGRLLDKNQ